MNSPMCVVPTTACQTCTGPRYNTSQSLSFKNVSKTPNVFRYTIPYTKLVAQCAGYFGKDTVKVGSLPAMSEFAMLFAFNATSSIRNTYFKSGAWLGLGPSDPAAFP